MAEEEKNVAGQDPQSAEEYAAAIKHLKDTTVSKEEYDKLAEEKKTLVKALSGEGPIPEGVQEAEEKLDIKELRKQFLNAGDSQMSNAEYVQLALNLRKACIAEGEPDPFLPSGTKTSVTNADIEGAEKVAEAFQEWLDASKDEEGKVDNELFDAFLKKGIQNDSPAVQAKYNAFMAAQKAKMRKQDQYLF